MDKHPMTPAAFYKESYPIDFDLLDEDGQSVLYIVNDRLGKQHTLEITNMSDRVIKFQPLGKKAGKKNHHFELKFRPGTFTKDGLKHLVLNETKDWDISKQKNNDGTISIYLLNKTIKLLLNSKDSIKIILDKVSAAGETGSRGTRVQLQYINLVFNDNQDHITGSRVKNIQIINELGKKNIPLHVGIAGSNRILNENSHPNKITLHIQNLLKKDPYQDSGNSIILNGMNEESPSKFIISFDENTDCALADHSQIKAINISSSKGWKKSILIKVFRRNGFSARKKQSFFNLER